MEIERKWMVQGWPQGLPLLETYRMDQGYISVRPTVRIRREALQGGRTALVLCFKGAPDKTGLMREEIETEITPELFEKLERLIGKPLIAKERRSPRAWCSAIVDKSRPPGWRRGVLAGTDAVAGSSAVVESRVALKNYVAASRRDERRR